MTVVIIPRILRRRPCVGHGPDEALLLPLGSHLVSVGVIQDLLSWAQGPSVEKQGQSRATGLLSRAACLVKGARSLSMALIHSPTAVAACFLMWTSGLLRAKQGLTEILP